MCLSNLFTCFLPSFPQSFLPSTILPPEVLAAQSLANIVKTSLGPVGLDKMLVDDVGVRRDRTHCLQ